MDAGFHTGIDAGIHSGMSFTEADVALTEAGRETGDELPDCEADVS